MTTAVYSVGVAKVDITPPLTIPFLGFTPRQGTFTGVHDPLYARALIVGSAGQEVVLICSDMIGYSDFLLEQESVLTFLARRIAERTGISAQNVLLFCTHAHSTPETLCITPMENLPHVKSWFLTHTDQLVSAVVLANQSRRQCVLLSGDTSGAELAWNRRIEGVNGRLYAWHHHPEAVTDWGENDHAIQVLVFADAQSLAPVCTIINFTCHPTFVQAQPLISADYPGVAMQLVENMAGGMALFLQGACGDVGPKAELQGFPGMWRQGLAVGGLVLSVLGRLLQAQELSTDATVRAVHYQAVWKTRCQGSDESLLLAKSRELSVSAEQAGTMQERERVLAEKRVVFEALRMHEIQNKWPQLQCDVAAIRLGNIAIAALPGEPFVTYGLQIKKGSPAARTLVAGYHGNYVGYLADEKAFMKGGYETRFGGWSRLEPGAGAYLTALNLELLHQLWA